MLTNDKLSDRILTMQKTKRLKEFFTVKDIARKLGVSRQAIDKRIRARRISVEVYGRTRLISYEDLERVLR